MHDWSPTFRIVLIGCGAVGEMFHLPAISRSDSAVATLLVDRQVDRARALADAHAVPFAAATWQERENEFDAAIVALPHALHAPVTIELLQAGKHVLVEKPMATTVADCEAMIAASQRGGVTLVVGQMRRFCPAVSLAKQWLDARLVGQPISFDIREGSVFSWPVASDFQFRKETAGGGVLFDTGAHTLDMARWLFGELRVRSYSDDAYGGVEADCSMELEADDGVAGIVELSRTRGLRNSAQIRCTGGTIELFFYENRLVVNGLDQRTAVPFEVKPAESISVWQAMFDIQLRHWVDVLSGRQPPLIAGDDAARTVALMRACYACRTPLQLPWVNPQPMATDV